MDKDKKAIRHKRKALTTTKNRHIDGHTDRKPKNYSSIIEESIEFKNFKRCDKDKQNYAMRLWVKDKPVYRKASPLEK